MPLGRPAEYTEEPNTGKNPEPDDIESEDNSTESGEDAAAATVDMIERPKGAFVELAEDAYGLWHWCLWASNGRIICRSGTAHDSYKACLQSLRNTIALWKTKLPIVRAHER